MKINQTFYVRNAVHSVQIVMIKIIVKYVKQDIFQIKIDAYPVLLTVQYVAVNIYVSYVFSTQN